MKKLSAVLLSLMLCVSVSFAARGGSGSGSSSSSKASKSSSSSSNGNFGIGYSKLSVSFNGMDVGLDEVAGRYWFSDNIGMDIKIGFESTEDIDSRFLIGGNIVGKIIKVNKLDIYWLAGLYFGNYTDKRSFQDVEYSIFVLQGGFGAEYYILPCLSVLTEMGLRYISVKPDGGDSVTRVGIFADWLPQAGVRFYF